jgi:hypothetical protein
MFEFLSTIGAHLHPSGGHTAKSFVRPFISVVMPMVAKTSSCPICGKVMPRADMIQIIGDGYACSHEHADQRISDRHAW